MPFFTRANQPNQVFLNSQGAVVQFVENSLCSHFPLILCHHPWAGTWHFWRGGKCGGVADFEEYLPQRGIWVAKRGFESLLGAQSGRKAAWNSWRGRKEEEEEVDGGEIFVLKAQFRCFSSPVQFTLTLGTAEHP